ncbi:hypothetical protein FF1_033679 [Malus domestica]|uniref:Uncharacterized protein n=1 Tax=Malus baccata TaxID=106549 RepID=A0A540KKJ3_MALBA|nr:hypothetical protein C1H46_039729 [Malus baccata]
MAASLGIGFATLCTIAILLLTGAANVCLRNIDCDFLIRCNSGGLKFYDHGECIYVGGHCPHVDKAPNSVVTVEEAGAKVCSRDIDIATS